MTDDVTREPLGSRREHAGNLDVIHVVFGIATMSSTVMMIKLYTTTRTTKTTTTHPHSTCDILDAATQTITGVPIVTGK